MTPVHLPPPLDEAVLRLAVTAMETQLDRIAAAVVADPRCPRSLHATRQATMRSIIGATLLTAVRGWRADDDPAGDIVEVIFSARIDDHGFIEACVSTDSGVELVETIRHSLPVSVAATWLHAAEEAIAAEGARLLATTQVIVDAIIEFTTPAPQTV